MLNKQGQTKHRTKTSYVRTKLHEKNKIPTRRGAGREERTGKDKKQHKRCSVSSKERRQEYVERGESKRMGNNT